MDSSPTMKGFKYSLPVVNILCLKFPFGKLQGWFSKSVMLMPMALRCDSSCWALTYNNDILIIY